MELVRARPVIHGNSFPMGLQGEASTPSLTVEELDCELWLSLKAFANVCEALDYSQHH